MSADLILFENSQLPAHLRAAFGDSDSNTDLSSGISTGYPIVSIKGKVFHVVQGDERTLLTNDDGDAKGSIEVVILKSNKHVSKVYYPSGYVEGSDAKPDCYSNNGETPGSDAVNPQSVKCATCPHNAWGSRITENGTKGKACSDSRRIAVASIYDLSDPMLLRIPAATLKELTIYADMLTKRKVPYRAIVTKIGFDHDVAHPKLTFKPTRFLTNAEAAVVVDVLSGTVVDDIIGRVSSEAPLEIAGTPPAALMTEELKTTVKTVTAKAEVVEAEVVEAKPAPKPEPKSTPRPRAEPKLKPSPKVVEEDADLDSILASLESDDQD
jgi:hypothetical protein